MDRQLVGDVKRIALNQGGVYGVVLDMAHVFMRGSVVDAFVDAFTGVFAGEVMSKIAVFPLVHFLVVVMSWPMTVVVAAGVPTTTVTTSHLVSVVVWRVITAMCIRSW
jgi:hypothetical protein